LAAFRIASDEALGGGEGFWAKRNHVSNVEALCRAEKNVVKNTRLALILFGKDANAATR
jgi:hypothetical protein